MASVVTVRGEIPPEKLGVTHPHEHVFLDIRVWLDESAPRGLSESPVTMEILADLRWKDGQNRDNMVLDSFNDAVSELTMFKRFGGRSLVDVTLPGIGRNPIGLRHVSEATGLNIMCSTGFYVAPSHPPFVKRKSIDDLAELMVRELEEGIETTGIRAGLIGELGCQEPLEAEEAKVLAAAAKAQARTGAGLTVHTALHDPANKRIAKQARQEIEILQRYDCDLLKVYISHMDFTYDDLKYHRDLVDEFGVTLDYDTFGQENSYHNIYFGAIGIPDSARCKALAELVSNGYSKKLMMSCDVCEKIHLRKYGGYGYSNILEHIVPLLRVYGVKDRDVRTMMVDNPKRILSR